MSQRNPWVRRTVSVRPFSVTLFVATFGISVAGSVQAASWQAQERAARKACLTGDYSNGVAILSDLFLDTKDPIWIFNQGRCLEQNRRYEDAIARFEEYLHVGETSKLNKTDRAAAQKHIADCQESLARQLARVPPLSEAPQPLIPAPQPAVLPAATPQPATPEVYSKPARPVSEDNQGKGLRIAGIILASVGVAAIGTGVGLALKSHSLSTSTYSKSREDERASLKTWGWVSYGVGAVALASGVVLYAVGWPSQQSSSVAVLPIVSPAGASMALTGRF